MFLKFALSSFHFSPSRLSLDVFMATYTFSFHKKNQPASPATPYLVLPKHPLIFHQSSEPASQPLSIFLLRLVYEKICSSWDRDVVWGWWNEAHDRIKKKQKRKTKIYIREKSEKTVSLPLFHFPTQIFFYSDGVSCMLVELF